MKRVAHAWRKVPSDLHMPTDLNRLIPLGPGWMTAELKILPEKTLDDKGFP
jgi:hypothetical protein